MDLLSTDYKGCFAFSLSGHDKGSVYVITDMDDKYVYLSDGRLKTVDSPKKKIHKHIQPVKKRADSFMEDMTDTGSRHYSDEQVKRAIKLYCSYLKKGKEA